MTLCWAGESGQVLQTDEIKNKAEDTQGSGMAMGRSPFTAHYESRKYMLSVIWHIVSCLITYVVVLKIQTTLFFRILNPMLNMLIIVC